MNAQHDNARASSNRDPNAHDCDTGISDILLGSGSSSGGATDVASLRKEYTSKGLREIDASQDPLRMFDLWFGEAVAASRSEPNAMALATAAADGQPSVRMVLLKGFDTRGFTFYTHYESRKGEELADNPRAALLFWWPELERQVRIEGVVETVPAEESDAYFHSRPWYSQVGACVSPQSRVIPDREFLERAAMEMAARCAAQPVPRPANWGGYRVIPAEYEFWQGRESRLHDRLRYRRAADGGWILERLAP